MAEIKTLITTPYPETPEDAFRGLTVELRDFRRDNGRNRRWVPWKRRKRDVLDRIPGTKLR